MVKKKVVDADFLSAQIRNMTYRTWAITPYFSGHSTGQTTIDSALGNLSVQIQSSISTAINSAMCSMLIELANMVHSAARDESDSMCGLCRIDPDQPMPVDYRQP